MLFNVLIQYTFLLLVCNSTSAPSVTQKDNHYKHFKGDTIEIAQFITSSNMSSDHSLILQKAVNSGKVVKINRHIIIRRNIYLPGNARLLGDSAGAIILDGDFANADGRKYVFNCGITSKRGTNEIWRGWVKDLRFIGTENAKFNYCIQLHNVQGVRIENCLFDFRNIPQSDERGDGRGTAVEGLNDRGWNRGSMVRKYVTIASNTVLNKQDNIGKEALGITNAENVVFDHNYCYGMGDDGIGIHTVKNFVVSNNRLFLVDGRILISNSQNGKIYNNYIERIPMQDRMTGIWANSESFIRLELESDNVDAPNNTNIRILNNTIRIPAKYNPKKKTMKTYVIRILGAIDCSIENNNIIIQCDSNLVAPPISIQRGIKKYNSNRQVPIQPRNITVLGNAISGGGFRQVEIGYKVDSEKDQITVKDEL